MRESRSEIEERVRAEAEAAEAAESAEDDDAALPAGSEVTRGRRRARVLQVRLNDDEYARLESLAAARGLPVSTVARGYILSEMAPESDASMLISRIEAELEVLRRAVTAESSC